MLRFSANLGFLWTELPLPAAIMAAAKAGFDAVECHWPFDVPSSEIMAALTATKLPMLGLNTRRGNVDAGDFGLAACVGREDEARRYIDEAVDYAAAIGAGSAAARHDMTVLIEPINQRDVANYHLSTVEAGVATIKQVGLGNIKLMFDCYHIQIMQGDLIRRIEANLDFIGHIQIAAVPDRAEPDHGELAYKDILLALDAAGYDGFIGAEYRPAQSTEAGLGWLETAKGWQE
jgi:hydroxypyruvate isomerase